MSKKIAAILIFVAAISAARLAAQGSQAQKVPTGPLPYGKSNLTTVQQDGQRMFMQRCSICHTPATPTARHIGPPLTKDLITGNENAIRQIIMVGTDRMPAYKYGLSATQINAIIEYLKTGKEATDVDQSGPSASK